MHTILRDGMNETGWVAATRIDMTFLAWEMY